MAANLAIHDAQESTLNAVFAQACLAVTPAACVGEAPCGMAGKRLLLKRADFYFISAEFGVALEIACRYRYKRRT
jgi:hypothetical protein